MRRDDGGVGARRKWTRLGGKKRGNMLKAGQDTFSPNRPRRRFQPHQRRCSGTRGRHRRRHPNHTTHSFVPRTWLWSLNATPGEGKRNSSSRPHTAKLVSVSRPLFRPSWLKRSRFSQLCPHSSASPGRSTPLTMPSRETACPLSAMARFGDNNAQHDQGRL